MLHNPIVISLTLLIAAAALRKRARVNRICFWMGVTVLLVCGNRWVVGGVVRHLERQHLPPDPLPSADCIVVLSGGVLSRVPPRPTVEITEAGNRVLYAAYLYQQGKASRIICTGTGTSGAILARSEAEDMAELLRRLGVPEATILKETKARNTHEHAINLYPLFQERGFKRVLLVTSAMHIPRSLAVFHRLCPGIEFIPAPTDFRAPGWTPGHWYRPFIAVIPTAQNLLDWSDATHEYLGIVYYKVRGWM
jgi:uncharacterized SAM-binding protein YcdF (DUF218 family)